MPGLSFTGMFYVVLGTVIDVAPIAAILLVFQVAVLRRTIPRLRRVLVGLVYVVLGLALFLVGLEQATLR